MLTTAVSFALSFAGESPTPSTSATRFQSKWRPDLQRAVAVDHEAPTRFPAHCDLAVVGAGWGGAYMAWRLSVDTKTVNASNVCVFEANGRVGGRIFSVRDLPHFGDLAIDVGGYRFQEVQKLPADLVFSALKMPTACYDWSCQAECEGVKCYVIKDSYGNNRGYATVIEEMLGEVEDAGAGTQVYFGARLTGVYAVSAAEGAAVGAAPKAVQLKFATGESVIADKVVLNLPGNAVNGLDNSSVLFTDATKATNKWLGGVTAFAMAKVYAWYDDAWWTSKLGLMEGYFTSDEGTVATNHSFSNCASDAAVPNGSAPLLGRYHDGPQRCLVGYDTAGDPVYSGNKVQYGNCSGALEVYYGRAPDYYQEMMTSPLEPLTVMTVEDGTKTSADAIKAIHESLMTYHAKALKAAKIDPATVAPPKAVVLGNWISDGKYTPGIGSLFGHHSIVPQKEQDAARKLVRRPDPDYEVFVADQDYGYHSGWAVGSLSMAEKILQAELGLPKPAWLNGSWYEENVLAHA